MKILPFLFASLFLISCGSKVTKNYQKNLENLDEVYGKCDNPHRKLSKNQRRICLDKERAAGPDGVIDDGLILSDIFGGSSKGQTIISSQINKNLWDASLSVLRPYAMKNIDFEGGFIETDWITSIENPNQRRLIKSHITSIELVSNGVKMTMICEEKKEGAWYLSQNNFIEEEKKLTLKVLETAQKLSFEDLVN